MTRFDISLIAGATLAVGLCMLAIAPARADAFMDGVKAEVVKFAGPQSDWRGPTSAPKPDPGKLIVYMSTDEQNDASREWGQAIQEAGAKIGWKVVIVDGHGTPVGWQQGLNQAIALKADGIVTNADAASLKEIIKDANDKGIVVVGIHATAFPGPQPDVGLFVNIQQDPRDIGRAQADWIIENSNGKARVVVTSHCEYAIACAKAHATEARIKECPGLQGSGVQQFANRRGGAAPVPARDGLGAKVRRRRSTSRPWPTTPRTTKSRRFAPAASIRRT